MMPVCVFVFARIVKDVSADSKEGKQAFKEAAASDSLHDKTASTSVSVFVTMVSTVLMFLSTDYV